MKFHDLEQGTEEWLEFRRTHIGASDAPIIIHGNKQKLIREKVLGTKKYQTPAMKRGHDLEPQARAIFENFIGFRFPPAVVTHDMLDWMSASLDGLCQERQEVLEIKCCGPEIHKGALKGDIPIDHMIQIQYQMWVTDYNYAHYCHFNGETIATVGVKRDDEWINEIVKECGAFYKDLCAAFNRPDDELEEIAAPIFHHERGEKLMKRLQEIRAQKKDFCESLCKEEKDLKSEILEIAPDYNFVLGGTLVYRSSGKVSYDIDRMKREGIDVSKYEKVGQPFWTIS